MALSGLTVGEVLRQVLAGIEEEGLVARLVQVNRSIDLGMIGWTAAQLSGLRRSRSACRRRGRRSSTAPTCHRSGTSSSSRSLRG